MIDSFRFGDSYRISELCELVIVLMILASIKVIIIRNEIVVSSWSLLHIKV